MELVKERKAARLQNDKRAGGASTLTRSATSAGDAYGDAMAEMIKRIKDGNVGLKKANRKFSEDIAGPPPDSPNFEKFKLNSTSKSATIDVRSRENDENSGDGDIFDNFRKGLKSNANRQKSTTLDYRQPSEPPSSPVRNFNVVLKSTPSSAGTRVKGSAIEEMRKLNVS